MPQTHTCQAVSVQLAWLPGLVFDAFIEGDSFDGWAECPYFDRANAERIVDAYNVLRPQSAFWKDDLLVIKTDSHPTKPELYRPWNIQTEQGALKAWTVCPGDWPWELC